MHSILHTFPNSQCCPTLGQVSTEVERPCECASGTSISDTMTTFNIPYSTKIYHDATRGYTSDNPLYPIFAKWSAHLYNYGIALITSASLNSVSGDTPKDQLHNLILDLWKGKGFVISMTPDDAPGNVTGWKMGDILKSKNGRCMGNKADIEIEYIFHDKENIEVFAGGLEGHLALTNIQFLLDRLRMSSSFPISKYHLLNNFHLEYDEHKYEDTCFHVQKSITEPPHYRVIKKYHDGSIADVFIATPTEQEER